MVGYVSPGALELAIGGDRNARPDDYTRVIGAATQEIDRWTGRRFLQDTDPSTRSYTTVDPDRVCVGDFVDPAGVVVETFNAATGLWETWDSSEWQPAADDQGNGPFVRLDGEPWRWIYTTGSRKFPTNTAGCWGTSASVNAMVRATTQWGWTSIPVPVAQACMELSIMYFQAKDRGGATMMDGDPVLVAKALVMDYAVEGGTIYCRPLVG